MPETAAVAIDFLRKLRLCMDGQFTLPTAYSNREIGPWTMNSNLSGRQGQRAHVSINPSESRVGIISHTGHHRAISN